MKDTKPNEGTGLTTMSKSITLWQNQKQHILEVPLSKDTNVATFMSAPGFSKYTAYCYQTVFDPNKEDSSPDITMETSIESEPDRVEEHNQSPNPFPVKLNLEFMNGKSEIFSP